MRELLARGREFLERKGVEEPRREAEWLAAHALGLSRLQVFLALDRPLESAEVAAARALFVRRGRREPTAYVTGAREFYGREFRVGPGVLVPRPETELLVDRARARLAGRAGARVVDVGTGSGCLAITLALECPGTRVAAVDSSARALEYARANAQRLGAEVEFHLGDALAPIAPGFDLLVSNPPYVDPAVAASLAPEVREHEPPEALFAPPGEPDHWARHLLRAGAEGAAPGAFLLIELGHDQAARLGAWPELAGKPHATWRDLARVERVLEVGPL
ncbi:MAG TPA: peptide chain release factor N(5)-glutamine methyltransferase [Planctomycetota bacterium]